MHRLPSPFVTAKLLGGGVATRPVRVLDGAAFSDFDGFCVEFSRSALDSRYDWRGNLDAFNDILGGGFGTPDAPWILRWKHVARSRETLGWMATKRWLAERMRTCHPANVEAFRERLAQAQREQGNTLFDELVSILRDHGAGGHVAEDGIILELEE